MDTIAEATSVSISVGSSYMGSGLLGSRGSYAFGFDDLAVSSFHERFLNILI